MNLTPFFWGRSTRSWTRLVGEAWELGYALCNFMQFVEWVKFVEGTSDNKTLVMAVQREHKMKKEVA